MRISVDGINYQVIGIKGREPNFLELNFRVGAISVPRTLFNDDVAAVRVGGKRIAIVSDKKDAREEARKRLQYNAFRHIRESRRSKF